MVNKVKQHKFLIGAECPNCHNKHTVEFQISLPANLKPDGLRGCEVSDPRLTEAEEAAIKRAVKERFPRHTGPDV